MSVSVYVSLPEIQEFHPPHTRKKKEINFVCNSTYKMFTFFATLFSAELKQNLV